MAIAYNRAVQIPAEVRSVLRCSKQSVRAVAPLTGVDVVGIHFVIRDASAVGVIRGAAGRIHFLPIHVQFCPPKNRLIGACSNGDGQFVGSVGVVCGGGNGNSRFIRKRVRP